MVVQLYKGPCGCAAVQHGVTDDARLVTAVLLPASTLLLWSVSHRFSVSHGHTHYIWVAIISFSQTRVCTLMCFMLLHDFLKQQVVCFLYWRVCKYKHGKQQVLMLKGSVS